MTCYIITFDVTNPDTRVKLEGRITEYGIYCPIHKNCWAIVTEQTVVQVRDYLMGIVSTPDKIFVIKSGVEAAWNDTYGQNHTNWLKEKL